MTESALTARLPALAGGLRAAPACWAFIGAGAAAIGVYFLLPPDAQSVFFVAVGLASVIAIYLGARTNQPPGELLPWNLIELRLLRGGGNRFHRARCLASCRVAQVGRRSDHRGFRKNSTKPDRDSGY